MRTRNRQRRAKRVRDGRVYGPYHRWVSSLPCAVLTLGECYGDVAGHHLKSVGAGGQDEGNEVPLCWWHHTELHTGGPSKFQARHGIILDVEAAYLGRRWTL